MNVYSISVIALSFGLGLAIGYAVRRRSPLSPGAVFLLLLVILAWCLRDASDQAIIGIAVLILGVFVVLPAGAGLALGYLIGRTRLKRQRPAAGGGD